MIIRMGDENGKMTSVQGLVPEEIATKFQAACKFHGLTQKEGLGRLAELFVRLPARQQGLISVALTDSEAFGEFMQAVDRVIAEAILSHLPSLGSLPSIEQLRGAIAAAEETARSQQDKRGPRQSGGNR